MDLNRATTFVRVVESGGFSRAAEAVGLPTSSVSRSVARLEEELGVVLLERTTRRVALTEAGRAYFERAREALAGLAEANTLALDAAREVQGVVRLAMPIEISASSADLITPFRALHPQVRIEVTFSNRGAELVGDLVDLAVVFGQLPDSSLISRRLAASTERLYAAPGYLAARGKPRAFADLAKHDALAPTATNGVARWELTGPDGAVVRVDVPAPVVGDHQQFLINAAVAGGGVVLLPAWIGDKHVAAGTLAAVLPKYSRAMPLHVLTHPARHIPRRVSLMRDYLYATLGVQCTKHGATG